MTFYRAPIVNGGGASATLDFMIQQSSDLNKWDDAVTPFDPTSPGTNTEGWVDQGFAVNQRFVKVGVKLKTGTDPSVTVWAQGWAARTMQ